MRGALWAGVVSLMLLAVSPAAAHQPLDTAPRTLDTEYRTLDTGYWSLSDALAAAKDGDVIEVPPGVYPGPVVVDKSVTLIGQAGAVIDGGGQGTVVTLAAPDIVFRGFEVRGSGREPDRDHSGLLVTAPGATIEANRIHSVLFGIFLSEAPDALVRGNDISSHAELELARKGDSVRVWYSPRAQIIDNTIHDARDIVIWYSEDLVARGNRVMRGRYGVHLMYCQGAEISGNQFIDNSVGIFTMYSRGVRLEDNLVRGQRGPSGYAMGFKDADDLEVAGNALIDNRAGLFLDGTPFRPGSFSRFHDNVVAFNDTGVILLPSARGSELTGNTFWENVEQVAFQGGNARAEANTWDGNTWSDYAGFDADGDGVGDVPYRAERLFDSLLDREPRLRLLLYSPAAQAVEFAGAALPLFRPHPKLVDPNPRLQPIPVQPAWLPARREPGALAAAGLGLLLVAALLVYSSRGQGSTDGSDDTDKTNGKGLRLSSSSIPSAPSAPSVQSVDLSPAPIHSQRTFRPHASQEPPMPSSPTLTARGLAKRYGSQAALDDLTFDIQPGEAIALWGANGAGKSTLLKALLGLVDFSGQAQVAGFDVRRQGKAARRAIGYVPQEAVFHDQGTQAALDFFARLKGLPAAARARRVAELLEQMGLADQARKPVAALSGGLRQRLALAIALLADPPVLLLDEPTANLDAQAQRDYLALLAHLRHAQGKTIVFASHRLEEVELLASRVLWLEHGRLVESLSPAELLARLMPFVRLTLWVPEAHRPAALARFTGAGLSAHLNGRGTVVVEVRAQEKMEPLHLLARDGIPVLNFEIERGATWN